MTATELVAGQGGRKDQQGGRIGRLSTEELGEGDIERAQPVALDPACEELQQLVLAFGTGEAGVVRHAIGAHAGSSAHVCAKRSSRASISARGGRSACRPWLGASIPRRNR